MRFLKRWARAYRQMRSLSKPNNFVKIFEIPDGQVLVEMEYPQMIGEPFSIAQKTIVGKVMKAKIAEDFPTEISMRNAFDIYDMEKAVKFNMDIQIIMGLKPNPNRIIQKSKEVEQQPTEAK